MVKLSVALAVFNEEQNIGRCLESIKEIADEIVVVDGSSADKTVEIAQAFHSKVIVTNNPSMFHINKQKAIDASSGDWVLQLDADEVVEKKLAEEIVNIVNMTDSEVARYEENIPGKKLFTRHQKLIEERDGKIGEPNKAYAAFFIPRVNFFLGRYLMHGGVYPDGVIRLFKKGKAYLPCKDVHEQFVVDGRVGWLQNNLLHYDSPTFRKYLMRNNRYTSLMASQYKEKSLGKNPVVFLNYVFLKPIYAFFLTFIRHKGFLDYWQGFVFSFYSSLRFAISYMKYLKT